MARIFINAVSRSLIRAAGSVLTALAAVARNPVLGRELRTRMRGSRSYWLLFGYLLVLCGAVFLIFLQYTHGAGYGASSARGELGKAIFYWVLCFQALMVMLVAPAFTAGAFTIEREQRTLDMLATTRLTNTEVAAGKLLAAAGFATILAFVSLPLAALSFLLGGISPQELLGAYAVLLGASLFYGALGLLWSSLARNTTAATVGAYGSAMIIYITSCILSLASHSVSRGSGTAGPFTAFNPLAAVFTSGTSEGYFGLYLPAWMVGVTLNLVLALALYRSAAANLEHFPERKPWSPLVFATLAWAFFILGWHGSAIAYELQRGFSPSAGSLIGQTSTWPIRTLASQTLLFLALVLPMLSTLGWSPASARRGPIAATVWVAVALGSYVLALAQFSRLHWGAAVAGMLLLAAVSWGIYGVCVGWRAILQYPWPARVAGYLTVTLLLALPEALGSSVPPEQPDPVQQLYYASPFFAIQGLQAAGDPQAPWAEEFTQRRSHLALTLLVPPWGITSGVWFLIGLPGCLMSARRKGERRASARAPSSTLAAPSLPHTHRAEAAETRVSAARPQLAPEPPNVVALSESRAYNAAETTDNEPPEARR
ncbi:MAG: ABC transporter permease [Armatimonadetes bacterium]|nr:ABC transporter permease [Armatimonadota bacterium]